MSASSEESSEKLWVPAGHFYSPIVDPNDPHARAARSQYSAAGILEKYDFDATAGPALRQSATSGVPTLVIGVQGTMKGSLPPDDPSLPRRRSGQQRPQCREQTRDGYRGGEAG